jgi:hypothetical protein
MEYFELVLLFWNLLNDIKGGDKNPGTEGSCHYRNSTKSPSACKSETLPSEAAKTIVFVEFKLYVTECFVFSP